MQELNEMEKQNEIEEQNEIGREAARTDAATEEHSQTSAFTLVCRASRKVCCHLPLAPGSREVNQSALYSLWLLRE